jgi:hypothetical protein
LTTKYRGTKFFHEMAKQRAGKTTSKDVLEQHNTPKDGPTISLVGGGEERRRALRRVRDHFAGDSPYGLFRKRKTSRAAQDQLLNQLKKIGATPDMIKGWDSPTFTKTEAEAAVKRMARSKAPGSDGIPIEFWATF